MGNPFRYRLERGHDPAQGHQKHVPSITIPTSEPSSGTLGTYIFKSSACTDSQAPSGTTSICILRNFVLIHPHCLQVNRNFRDIVDRSPETQYLIDLHAVGLEVELQDSFLSLTDRREQLDRYQSRWESLQCTEHTSLPLPLSELFAVKGSIVCLVILAGFRDPTADYHFIQLPSALGGIPLKEWTLSGSFPSLQLPGLLPEEDLLVICFNDLRYSSEEVHDTPG